MRFLLITIMVIGIIYGAPKTNETDSLALIAIRNANSGNTLTWDTAELASSWEGVTVNNSTGRIIALNINSKGITILPPEIGDIDSLKSLYLSYNGIASLPSEMRKLKSLSTLHCLGSFFTSFPEELDSLSGLATLVFSSSQLDSILPTWIGNLTNLRELTCERSNLTSLPEEIKDLPNITYLDFSNNLFDSIPSWIAEITGLTYMAWSQNKITEIPTWIGNLANLESLYLSNNQLTSLPEEIGNLSNLKALSLATNQIKSILPIIDCTKLEYLSLNSNKISFIYYTVGDLDSLKSISCSNNLLAFNELKLVNALPAPTKKLFPQDSLGHSFRIEVDSTISSTIGGEDNTYAWFNTSDLSTPVSTSIDVSPSVEGQYVCIVKNPAFPNDSLIQKEITAVEFSREKDSLALVAFLNSNPDNTLEWNKATPIDTWEGVWVNSDGRVDSLNLGGKNLNVLPPEIGDLRELVQLQCHWNNLTELPAEITELCKITGVTFEHNKLTSLPMHFRYISQEAWYVNVLNNQLHFDDLSKVNYVPSDQAVRLMFPQDSIGPLDTVEVNTEVVSIVRRAGVKSNVTYEWFNTNNMNSPVVSTKEFTPTEVGTYVCIVKDTYFPEDSLIQKKLVVAGDVAIKSVKAKQSAESFLAYPSPVKQSAEEVNLLIPEELVGQEATCIILSSLGAVLDHQTVTLYPGENLHWDLRNANGVKVACGSYMAILRVNDAQGRAHVLKTMIAVKK